MNHVVRFTRPSGSVFAYCKQSKTGAREGLEPRLIMISIYYATIYHEGLKTKCKVTFCSQLGYTAMSCIILGPRNQRAERRQTNVSLFLVDYINLPPQDL